MSRTPRRIAELIPHREEQQLITGHVAEEEPRVLACGGRRWREKPGAELRPGPSWKGEGLVKGT